MYTARLRVKVARIPQLDWGSPRYKLTVKVSYRV